MLSDPKEKQTYEEQLRGLLGDSVEFVPIPEGRSEQELWEIFNHVANAVGEGDTILLDTTHAFRSIPMIVFAVAAYLRRTKEVTIAHVVYGAFEARDENNRAPIFDLTPLLELLDWTSGAEALLKRGDAELIAEKIVNTHQTLRRRGTDTPKKLKPLGQKLRALSRALHLSRPREVMRTAHELLSLLEEARDEFQRWALPFALLAEQIRCELEPLAFAEPDALSRENLERQVGLVEYYLRTGLVVQAVTLAREWVISFVLLCRGGGNWLRRVDREEVERALGTAVACLRGETAEVPGWFDGLPQRDRKDLSLRGDGAAGRAPAVSGTLPENLLARAIRLSLSDRPGFVRPSPRLTTRRSGSRIIRMSQARFASLTPVCSGPLDAPYRR